MSNPSPPKYLLKFFRWFCHPEYLEDIEGDLVERFERNIESGQKNARLQYSIEILKLIKPEIMKPLGGTYRMNLAGMLKNQVVMSWRFMRKNKLYATLNIGGLAIGIFIAMIIGLWLHDEISYNTYNQNYETAGQVLRKDMDDGVIEVNSALTTGVGTLLENQYGNLFEEVCMVRARVEHRVVTKGRRTFTQSGYFMQPNGTRVFDLNMIHGSSNGLKDLATIILSESLAKKLFDNENPIGEVITMNDVWELKVTGVYEDLPKNSELHQATYFAPLDLYLYQWADLNNWDNYNMYLYVQLKPGTSYIQASDAIKEAMYPHVDMSRMESNTDLFVHPMKDWHLNSEFENGELAVSNRKMFVIIYSIIGVFVLLLACINFMNLSTAISEKRAKEIGIRKTMGSGRIQLIYQFLSESFLIAIVAGVIALVLVYFTLPWFCDLAQKNLILPYTNIQFWALFLGFILTTSFLAGIYPAFYLSSFNPVQALKTKFVSKGSQSIPRKVLVAFQFIISGTLIVSSLLINEQVQHAKNRPVGYDQEGLISFRPGSPDYFGKYDILRSSLLKTGMVEEIAECNYAITSELGWNPGFKWQGQPEGFNPAFNINYVTAEYGKTLGWEFLEGRDFTRDIATDEYGIVINESAAKIFGFDNPIDQPVSYDHSQKESKHYKILGVIKDQIKGSPFENTHPAITFLSKNDLPWLFIKLKPGIPAQESIPIVAEAFNEIVPSAPFDFQFVDEVYNIKFQEEDRIVSLVSLFSIFAIAISCIGLFGLVSYISERRTKEVGIRKVLGATMMQLWKLLSKDFMFLVLFASGLSLPIAYWIINNWLSQYEYRIEMSWKVFGLAILVTGFIALLTVSYHTIRIALSNPVKSLRDE